MLRKVFISMLAVTTIFVVLLQSAGNGGSVKGVVKNPSGEPVVGAFVRIKNAERRLSVTVISRDLGRYNASGLLQGKYTVQSVGGGAQSEDTAVELDGSHDATVNLVLTSPADFNGNISITDMAALMPEGEGKMIILGECTHCHLNGLQEFVVQRKNREGWEGIIAKMEGRPFASIPTDSANLAHLDIEPRKREVVIDYLTRNFGPDVAPFDKNKLPKGWVTGTAAKSVVTEFSLPAGAKPHDMSVDSKGIVWVAERTYSMLGRFDPQTASYTRIPLPGRKSSPEPIVVDPKDRVWMADIRGKVDSRLIEYDPKTGTFTIYPVPQPPNAVFGGINAIRFLPDGSVWACLHKGKTVVRIDSTTKQVSEYPIPADTLYGMAIDGNNAVWVSDQMAGKMARIDSKSGQFTEIDLPTKDSMPQRLAADAEGNLWVPEYRSGKLAMIDYRTLKVTEYPTPTKNSGPYSVAVDKARNQIWFNEMMASQIARFDPRTKKFVEYALPTRLSSVRIIELDPTRPNRIWFSSYLRDNVGYMDVIE